MSTRDRVLLAARAELVATGELDMGAVATRAGIGRSTLYRVCGDREQLRELVLRWMAELGWARSTAAADGLRGRARCLAVIAEYTRLVAEDPGLRRAVQAAPERTVAMCTDHRGPVQPWVVAQLEALLREHGDELALTMPVDRLAFAIVRLAESFVYSDVIAARPVDLDALGGLVALLLPPRPRRRSPRTGHARGQNKMLAKAPVGRKPTLL